MRNRYIIFRCIPSNINVEEKNKQPGNRISFPNDYEYSYARWNGCLNGSITLMISSINVISLVRKFITDSTKLINIYNNNMRFEWINFLIEVLVSVSKCNILHFMLEIVYFMYMKIWSRQTWNTVSSILVNLKLVL